MSEEKGFQFILNKDYLIVEIEEMATETVSGLYVPNAEFIKGTVACAGEGYHTPYGFIKNPYKEGDKVLLDKATLESAKVRRIPQNLYENGMVGSRLINFDIVAYLISSDLVLGKWEKRVDAE